MLEFLEDYGNSSMSVFSKFRSNPRLIKYWDDLEIIADIRNQIKVLEDHHRLISEVKILTSGKKIKIIDHIHLGEVYSRVNYNSSGKAMNTSIILSGKHNRAISFDNYPPGIGKWAFESVLATDNLNLGYKYGKLVRNCEDIPDLARLDAQGNPLPWRFKTKDANGNNTFSSIKVKDKKTTTWPNTYSQNKIDAYTTYAYQNMTFDRIEKGNFVFVGRQPDNMFMELVFDNIDPALSSTKRITSYPIINP